MKSFLAIAVLAQSLAAAAIAAPDIHIILLVADGLEPPATAVKKIGDAALYAESFLISEMTRWGYEPTQKQVFPRDEDDRPIVRLVRGNKAPADYTEMLTTMREVWPKAHGQYDLPKNNPIWWTWVYKGDPPVRYSNYRGTGDISRGGYCINNYENRTVSIDSDRPMATADHDEFTLKGCIHELGHAFGLPHLGPKEIDDRGNTLMGPRTVVFDKQTSGKDRRVYLSEAAAAMLWKHWIFTGDDSRRRVMPKFTTRGWDRTFSRKNKTITFRGRINSDIPAHSIVLVDEVPPKQVNYWAKPYVGRVADDGSFTVIIDEPLSPQGTAKFVFCFENGVITGDGKGHGLASAIDRPYDLTK